jgi:hypothetical protein
MHDPTLVGMIQGFGGLDPQPRDAAKIVRLVR